MVLARNLDNFATQNEDFRLKFNRRKENNILLIKIKQYNPINTDLPIEKLYATIKINKNGKKNQTDR